MTLEEQLQELRIRFDVQQTSHTHELEMMRLQIATAYEEAERARGAAAAAAGAVATATAAATAPHGPHLRYGVGDLPEFTGDPKQDVVAWLSSVRLALQTAGVTDEAQQVRWSSLRFPSDSAAWQFLQTRAEQGGALPTTWAEWAALLTARFTARDRRLQTWRQFNSLQCGMKPGQLSYPEYRQQFEDCVMKLGPGEAPRDGATVRQRWLDGLSTSGALYREVLSEDERHFMDTGAHLDLQRLVDLADREYYVLASVRLGRQGRLQQGENRGRSSQASNAYAYEPMQIDSAMFSAGAGRGNGGSGSGGGRGPGGFGGRGGGFAGRGGAGRGSAGGRFNGFNGGRGAGASNAASGENRPRRGLSSFTLDRIARQNNVTRQEAERRYTNSLCYKCGRPGHTSAECKRSN